MALIVKEAWRISLNRTCVSLFLSQQNNRTPTIIRNIRDFCSGKRINQQKNCSRDKNVSSSSSIVTESLHEPISEADLKTISGANIGI